MRKHWQSSWKSWGFGVGGSGVVVLALAAACSLGAGGMSEIDSYDSAVRTQSVAESRAFVSKFRTSHLVGDLIESLPPDVALQVCEDLPFGTSAKARRSCEQLRDTIAAQPAAANTPVQLAASSPIAMSTAASNCVGTSFDLPSTGGKPVAKAKRSTLTTVRTRPSQTEHFWQVAAAERGNKEVRN
jgi:hypothetical protein